MYSKFSRYRALPEVVAVDANGRRLRSTRLRLPPVADGVMEHTVEEVDRLDYLAHRYYRQPRHWWHICDANPQVRAPQALLGREPWEVAVVPVTWEGERTVRREDKRPRWSSMARAIAEIPGVRDVQLGSEDAPTPDLTWVDGDAVAALSDAALLETLQNVEDALRTPETPAPVAPEAFAAQLGSAIASVGPAVTMPVRLESTSPVRHTIIDDKRRRYVVRYVGDESLVQVFAPDPRHEWVVQVSYNTLDLSPEVLAASVEDAGFAAGMTTRIRRLGKAVAIPTRPQL